MAQVIVYSTPTCPYCIRAKQFLMDNKIEFINYDVSVDTHKAEEMVQKSEQMGVPVIDVDGQIVIGFDKERLKQLLLIK